jgi:hypothetical protein
MRCVSRKQSIGLGSFLFGVSVKLIEDVSNSNLLKFVLSDSSIN